MYIVNRTRAIESNKDSIKYAYQSKKKDRLKWWEDHFIACGVSNIWVLLTIISARTMSWLDLLVDVRQFSTTSLDHSHQIILWHPLYNFLDTTLFTLEGFEFHFDPLFSKEKCVKMFQRCYGLSIESVLVHHHGQIVVVSVGHFLHPYRSKIKRECWDLIFIGPSKSCLRWAVQSMCKVDLSVFWWLLWSHIDG